MKKINVMLFSGALLALASAPTFAQGEQPNGGAPQNGGKNQNAHTSSKAHSGQPQRQRKADHAFRQGHALPHQYRAKQYYVDDWRARTESAAERPSLGTGE
ncbi:hypothetical protein SGGMMB4_01410 [Sodalis glossinidius str. 'morsitans']|uniref:Acid shock protein n=1 Tax=Sodalis glossinidius (strain morsitans) TaxID=343509 RepID=A0A193QGQ1_SODGM|nr:hypothetical protein [Sodalis glossinidius]CRL44347.1 hypothetical protein SGGMMB4_01410 [Sodalis glossinidius str. 'morsitans']